MTRVPSIALFWFAAVCFLGSSAIGDDKSSLLPGFSPLAGYAEQTRTITNASGVRIYINAPLNVSKDRPITLVYFALPNGNTIEQTIGKKMKAGDDWHFNIQHIGAQTRFVRERQPDRCVVVAYLENTLKSWPAWRKAHGDKEIPGILDSVKTNLPKTRFDVVLTGHSGGGSLTFGYLNSVTAIPDDVKRIAFIDSNYAYETEKHRDKLVTWLKGSTEHSLLVFAYHDDIALLDGKTFVSASGGTWGRSHVMKQDFSSEFKFEETQTGEIKTWSTLDGRLRFFLKDNPEKKIYHTVQVERNGFIHALLTNSPDENKGYRYFGPRAYENLVTAE